jgi:SAM-dependent methyltransferase
MRLRPIIKKIPFAQTSYAFGRQLVGDLHRETRFEEMCQRHGPGKCESRSGPGSTLANTSVVRAELPELIQRLGVTSILDIPCGDFHWMQYVDLPGIRYIGADIVGDLIALNRERFGSGRKEFRVLDLTVSELPSVDLILCRDCLVHCSYKLIRKALRNLSLSQSRYLLTTTFPGHNENVDICTGDWRPLNLSAPPFSFPPPLWIINEQYPDQAYRDKSLGLWFIESLKASNQNF